jgi:hypothetical protein
MKKQAAVKASKKTKSVSIADVKAFILLADKVGAPVTKAKGFDLLMAAK